MMLGSVLNAAEWDALLLSMEVACGCVLMIAIPGVAIGWLLARKSFPGKIFVDGLVHLPLVMPPVVVGYCLLIALGRNGFIGRWLDAAFGIRLPFTLAAVVIASAVMAFPLLVRSVRLSIELVDQDLEQASATLGAGPFRTFATVTLPLAAPGILAGLVLAFARSLGEFGATITFAGNVEAVTRTLPLEIYTKLQVPGGEAAVVRLAVISILISFAALIASELIARRMRRRLGGNR